MNVIIDVFMLSALIFLEIAILKRVWNANQEIIIPAFYHEVLNKNHLSINNEGNDINFDVNQCYKDDFILIDGQDSLKSKYEGEQYYTFK